MRGGIDLYHLPISGISHGCAPGRTQPPQQPDTPPYPTLQRATYATTTLHARTHGGKQREGERGGRDGGKEGKKKKTWMAGWRGKKESNKSQPADSVSTPPGCPSTDAKGANQASLEVEEQRPTEGRVTGRLAPATAFAPMQQVFFFLFFLFVCFFYQWE